MKYTYDVESYEHAYLRISNDDLKAANISNPFDDMTDWQKDNFHLHVLSIMRDPRYMHWTIKHLLNIDLLPQQVVILQELWVRSFPMYIASRGYGKSFLLAVYATLRCLLVPESKIVIVGAAFRQSKVIFEYMDVIWKNAPLLRSLCSESSGPRRDVDRCTLRINDSWTIAVPLGDGCLSSTSYLTYQDTIDTISVEHDTDHPDQETVNRKRNVWGNGRFRESDESYCNGVKDTKSIVTKKGYNIEGTLNHKIKVYNKLDLSIGWKRFDEISVGDHPVIDRSERWHKGEGKVTADEAYAVGLMIGDGCWTQDYRLSFATKDDELAQALIRGTGLSWKRVADNVHWNMCGKEKKANFLSRYGLTDKCYAKDKTIPQSILSSSKEAVSACLSALYDTDGHIQVQTAKGGTGITIGFTNTSERLIDQMHYLLLHFGIVAYKTSRDRNENWNTIYELLITGKDVRLFYERINFRLARKRRIFDAGMQDKIREVSAGDIIPGLIPTMTAIAKDNRRVAMPKISASKIEDRKEATRDLITDFCAKYMNAKGVSHIEELNDPDIYYDEVESIVDGKAATYDVHVPDEHEYCANGFFSHNTKIRGLRAHTVIADEFNSIPVEIYETVVAGFASVHKDPAQNVKEAFRRNAMKADDVWTEYQEESYKSRHKNQSILSGTAGYDFEPYADYWRVYKKMIKGEGYDSAFGDDEEKVENEKGMPEYMERLDRGEFSIIRIPYELIPEGFMDDQQVSRSRATMHSGIFIMEYSACFAKDSQGFFKRTLIEGATATDKNLAKSGWPQWCDDPFEIITKGRAGKQYVFGIDPASENDNFAIVIIELHPEHHRIAYVWTTNKKDFSTRKKLGLTDSDDYYGFCVRKIRDLYRLFPCVGIGIDSQGGGYVIAEGLRDKDKILAGERPLLPIINDKKEADTDLLDGDHIIDLIQFASAEWTSKANHGLRKDMEDKVLLFPRFDNVTLSLVSEHDKIQFKKLKERLGDSPALKLYDTLEDCVMEVEELKTELSTITMSRTASGRERFDTPEIKLKTGKKGRMRKDRYSALVIVNMLARSIQREITPPAYVGVGRIAQVGSINVDPNKPMYVGPQHWASYSPKAVKVIRSN